MRYKQRVVFMGLNTRLSNTGHDTGAQNMVSVRETRPLTRSFKQRHVIRPYLRFQYKGRKNGED